MGKIVTIDASLVTYDIQNKEGELLGQFSFNPSDTNIIKRYNNAVEKFSKVFDELKELEEDDTAKVFEKLDEKTYEFIDEIFNADVSSNFFSIMGPFSLLESGKFFVESVIDAIGQALEAEIGERVKRMNNKVKKYTSKYHG